MRAVIMVVVLLALGGVVAWQVNDALGLSVRPADVPTEDLTAAPPRATADPPAIPSIGIPDDPRVRLAAGTVADALVERGRPRPATGSASGPSRWPGRCT